MLVDAFTPDAFNLVTMTDTINKVPYKPGFVSKRGLFSEAGVSTLVVALEEREGVISLVQTKARNGPRGGQTRERRKLRTFEVPHLKVEDYIRADEVQGVRAFGSENQALAVETVRDDRLMKLAHNLDATLDHHRVGAIKGIVYDADGSSVLFNLFTEFGVTAQTEIDFDLDNASPASGALRKKIGGAIRNIMGELGGIDPTGFEALCGDAFFDDLIAHPEVRETYKYQQGAKLREGYVYDFVDFGGIRWINYRNGGFSLVNTDKCHIYPLGVDGLFITRFAPAPYLETVNTLGLPRYAKGIVDQWNTQVDIEVQTNPLNLCTRPRALQGGRRT